MPEERLQKLIARAGMASRREAESWIEAGQVTVNGRKAKLGDKADPEQDTVKARGRVVRPVAEHRSYLLNKPAKTVSSRRDPQGRPTVYQCLPQSLRNGLFTIGRLDWNTEGALVLTTDGDLAQRVAHPRYGGSKRYLVKVKGVPDEASLGRLRSGVNLYGRKTLPVRVERHHPKGVRASKSNSWWILELREGRTRQIRETLFRLGHPVLKLRRISIAELSLGGLKPGAWRELTAADLEALTRTGGK